jgi:hypothetical protein
VTEKNQKRLERKEQENIFAELKKDTKPNASRQKDQQEFPLPFSVPQVYYSKPLLSHHHLLHKAILQSVVD